MRRHRRPVSLSIAVALVVGAAPALARTESLPEIAHTVITGADPRTFFGLSLDPAGDFDGDGVDDLVAGGRNVAYVIRGGARGSMTTEDPRATRFGFTAEGPRHQIAVAGAGDVDGDGFDDVLVGAPRLDRGGERNAGAAFLVFGRAEPQDTTLDAADAVRVVRIAGAQARDRAGYSVAGAGDVDGDGFPDVVVGARGAGARDRGGAYVLSGRSLTAPVDLATLGPAGFRIHDPAFGAGVGHDVSPAGDMNGDGLGDVLVGAPSNPGQDPPAAYVVFGSAEDDDVRLRDQGTRGWAIRGSKSGIHAAAGEAVAGGHDVNGDGVPDVVIGAREARGRYGHQGAAFVVFGKADTNPVRLADIAEHGFVAEPGDAGGLAGDSVALVPDLDGNGFSDVLLGDPLEHVKDRWGAVYHLIGQSSHERIELDRLGEDGVRYVAEGESFVGTSVGAAGDFDADGTLDLAAAAPQDPAGNIELGGVVYLFTPVEPPPNDPPPGASLVSYFARQRPVRGSYCWDGLCADRRPTFPEAQVVGTGDRAHFRILYEARPDDASIVGYRELDEFGRPAGPGRVLPVELRPFRHLSSAPPAGWQLVFRLPERAGDVHLAAFARWDGPDRGDVSWFSHLRLKRSAAATKVGSPPEATLIGGGVRRNGQLTPSCWTTLRSNGTGSTMCAHPVARVEPLPAERAAAGARAVIRIRTRYRPDKIRLRFYRDHSSGYPSGDHRRVAFRLRRHRVDRATRAWDVAFRLPARSGHLYPEMNARWGQHGSAGYDWHLRLR